jgi:hypothetical protein
MDDRAHLRRAVGPYGVGVVPEIETIDIAMIEPEAHMVRMVHTFAGTRLQRIASGHELPTGAADREEHRLLQ